MLNQIHGAHPPGTKHPQDGVSRKLLANCQRHEQILCTPFRKNANSCESGTNPPAFRNPGDFWDGVGSTTNDICAEEQTFNDGRPSETKTNNTGQYFGFTLSADMASLNLKGNCRWLISPCNGKKGPCTARCVSPGIDDRERYRA
jgi:hypothetical protein